MLLPGMEDNLNQTDDDENTDPIMDPNLGAGASPDPNRPRMTNAQVIEERIRLEGGLPGDREGAPEMDEVSQLLLNNQYRQDIERMHDRETQELAKELPNATENQIDDIILSSKKGDIIALARDFKAAMKTDMEVSEKEEKQEKLSIKGGESESQPKNYHQKSSLDIILSAFDN